MMGARSGLRLATSVSDSFLDALGAVIINFSALEHSLSVMIWLLLDDREGKATRPYRIVTSQLSFRQLLNVFATLCRERPELNHEELETLVHDCDKVNERRNSILHSLWVQGTPSGSPQAESTRHIARLKKFDTQCEVLTRGQIVDVADRLMDLDVQVRTFVPDHLLQLG